MGQHPSGQPSSGPAQVGTSKSWTTSLLMLGTLMTILLLSACGGNGTGSPPPPPTPTALFSDDQQVTLTTPTSNSVQSHQLLSTLPTDLMVTVQVTLQQASADDSAGILLRTTITSGPTPQTVAYWVEIYGNNTIDIWKNYPDPTNSSKIIGMALTGPSPSAAIHPQGQPNKMTVMIKGTSIALFINDQFIATVTDSQSSTALTTGDTRLFVSTGKSGIATVALFQSVAVYPAPATLPTH